MGGGGRKGNRKTDMTDRQMHRRGERGERDTDMNRQSDAQTERKRGERYRQIWTDSLIHRRRERGEIDTDMNKQSDAQTERNMRDI